MFRFGEGSGREASSSFSFDFFSACCCCWCCRNGGSLSWLGILDEYHGYTCCTSSLVMNFLFSLNIFSCEINLDFLHQLLSWIENLCFFGIGNVSDQSPKCQCCIWPRWESRLNVNAAFDHHDKLKFKSF